MQKKKIMVNVCKYVCILFLIFFLKDEAGFFVYFLLIN